MQATALALCFLTACPAAVAANGHADGVVGLAILKQPRVGSTWVKKELNQLPGVHLEFEPLTDGTNRCPSNFTNAPSKDDGRSRCHEPCVAEQQPSSATAGK